MSKELDLEIYDIVKIVEGNGSIYLESINEIHNDENGKLAFTNNFVIDLKNVEVNCISDGNPYQLEMIWRLDGNRNYTMIYPIQRLEAIDNAKPSEALGTLDGLYSNVTEEINWHWKGYARCNEEVHKYDDDFKCIKQALIKSQEQEKVLSIIKEKHISVWRFRNIVFGYEQKQNGNNVNDTYEYYTHCFGYYHEGFEFELLTEEEFELLKQYFGKNIQK